MLSSDEVPNVQDIVIKGSISNRAQDEIDSDKGKHQERLDTCGHCAPTKRLLMTVAKHSRQGDVCLNESSSSTKTNFNGCSSIDASFRVCVGSPHSPLDNCSKKPIDHPNEEHGCPETIHGPSCNKVNTFQQYTSNLRNSPIIKVGAVYDNPVNLGYIISQDLLAAGAYSPSF